MSVKLSNTGTYTYFAAQPYHAVVSTVNFNHVAHPNFHKLKKMPTKGHANQAAQRCSHQITEAGVRSQFASMLEGAEDIQICV
jgi:hypothetical protein